MSSNIIPYDCVHTYFEAHAVNTPGKVALRYKDLELTYHTLNQQANQLAHYLISLGVGPEIVVGICLERSPEFVIGLLAILKAGGAYVSLPPTDPIERVETILIDASAPFLLTNKEVAPDIKLDSVKKIYFDDITGAEQNRQNPHISSLTAENLAYINYTSGSTGKPKGAQIPHRSVGGYMFNIQYAKFDSEEIFLQHSATAWDALTLELWTPLMHGAQCVLYPEQIPTPQELGTIIRDSGVTTLWLTSSLFNLLVDTDIKILSNVRQLLVGGEALSVSHINRALHELPNTKLINGYGPSECTVFSCCHPITSVDVEKTSIPIGRPIGDRIVYLLDKFLNRAPIGMVGELYISGPSVTRGYLNRPGLTAETLLPDPFSQKPGQVMYKTGDLARYLSDGTIEFVGRDDDQIKLRGFRIELGEIENALHEHPDIKNALVIPRDDGPGNNRHLVAYIVSDANANLEKRPTLRQLPNDMSVYDNNPDETYWMYRNIFVEKQYWTHGLTLPENACVFDVGANIGLFTLFIHQIYPPVQTYAFEPIPRTFEKLKQNVAHYGLNTKPFNMVYLTQQPKLSLLIIPIHPHYLAYMQKKQMKQRLSKKH